MQKANVRSRFGNNFAIELEDKPQNSMRGRMGRSHVQHHLFADIVIGMAQFCVRRDDSRYWVRRFNLTCGEGHKIDRRNYARDRE